MQRYLQLAPPGGAPEPAARAPQRHAPHPSSEPGHVRVRVRFVLESTPALSLDRDGAPPALHGLATLVD
eukprot:2800330-Prymnesium_polylepis.1